MATLCATVAAQASAANTADAQLVLTFTLDDVIITDTLTNHSTSATFETSSEVGDLIFEDIGPNSWAPSGGAPANPVGSIGSASSSESVLFNGLDPFIDDYDQDSFGIGDSVVLTMNVSASATTPGSIFFAQVASDIVLYFGVYGEETDQYTFRFTYDAQLTGTLDNTSLPGNVLAFGEGFNVNGHADSTVAGPPNDFEVFDALPDESYFFLGAFNAPNTFLPLNESDTNTFDVVFDPGDSSLSINFLSGLLVNATVEVPEPTSLGLLLIGGLPLLKRRHTR